MVMPPRDLPREWRKPLAILALARTSNIFSISWDIYAAAVARPWRGDGGGGRGGSLRRRQVWLRYRRWMAEVSTVAALPMVESGSICRRKKGRAVIGGGGGGVEEEKVVE